jgi:LuxR family transcriptional regulator of spore coat protein
MDTEDRKALTPRELMVVRLIAEGHSAKGAARELDISPRTVEKHIDQARLKLRAINRAHLISLALTGGAILPGPSSD